MTPNFHLAASGDPPRRASARAEHSRCVQLVRRWRFPLTSSKLWCKIRAVDVPFLLSFVAAAADVHRVADAAAKLSLSPLREDWFRARTTHTPGAYNSIHSSKPPVLRPPRLCPRVQQLLPPLILRGNRACAGLQRTVSRGEGEAV